MVAHLTNADQGEMSWSSPWDLGPGCGHLTEDHGRGREYTIVYLVYTSNDLSVLSTEFNCGLQFFEILIVFQSRYLQ